MCVYTDHMVSGDKKGHRGWGLVFRTQKTIIEKGTRGIFVVIVVFLFALSIRKSVMVKVCGRFFPFEFPNCNCFLYVIIRLLSISDSQAYMLHGNPSFQPAL